MKPLYKRYANEEPAGVYSMGYCGYLFFEPKEDDRYMCDYVVCFECPCSTAPDGYARSDYRRHTVTYGGAEERYHGIERRPHIWRDHARVYLDDVLRTNF